MNRICRAIQFQCGVIAVNVKAPVVGQKVVVVPVRFAMARDAEGRDRRGSIEVDPTGLHAALAYHPLLITCLK